MTINLEEKRQILNVYIHDKQDRLSELNQLLAEQRLIENNQLMIEKVSANVFKIEAEIAVLEQALDDLQ